MQRLVRGLRREGELRDTLMVFTSDNGFLLGEHGHFRKRVLYEEAIRVPLLMRGPGIPSGEVRSQPVGNIDLAPSILAATGVEPGATMDGRSLLPLTRHPVRGQRRSLLLELPRITAIRTPRFVYSRRELYDLDADPFQLVDLSGRRPFLERRLASRVQALRSAP